MFRKTTGFRWKFSFQDKQKKINLSANLFPLVVIDGDGDEYMYFPLQFDIYKFTIRLSDILMCLKLAEEEGSIPLLSKDSWYELGNLTGQLVLKTGRRKSLLNDKKGKDSRWINLKS